MAIDHFAKHNSAEGRGDWNFNILFDEQPQVGDYAEQFHEALNHPGLYPPIPLQWLHATVLRVGSIEDFTEAEMLEVADRLENKLATMRLPEFLLGQWWIWSGNPCVHFTPEDPLNLLFNTVTTEVIDVVGGDRVKEGLKFTPHITLAYSKSYDDEKGLFERLQTVGAHAVPVRAKSVGLLRQYVEDHTYKWEVVRDIQVGQK